MVCEWEGFLVEKSAHLRGYRTMSRRQATKLAFLCFGIAAAMVIVSFGRLIAAVFDDRYLVDIDYAYVVTQFAGNSLWNAGVFLVPGLVFYWLRDSLDSKDS